MSSENTRHSTTTIADYTVASLLERPDLADEHQTVGGSAWPEFMVHDPIAIANWDKMMRYFAIDQLSLLVEDQIAAVINMVPICVETDLIKLSDRGVDWGVERSVENYEQGVQPNALMGLQVVIAKTFRRRNLSETATREMISHARRRNCDLILLPVRPNGKHVFPPDPDGTIHQLGKTGWSAV